MNKRKVYLGEFNNSKKDELIEKSLKLLKENKGNKFFYVLPNGDLLKKYRKYFIENINYSLNINLLTFDDIVQRFAGDMKSIDNAMKNLIIKNVLEKLSSLGKLKYFKGHTSMEGFANSCNYIIGEIKRSLITPEEYLDRSPDGDLYLEMGYIYEEYENTLKTLNLVDREGKYFVAIKNLNKRKTHIKDLKFIIIDEFYDFRPIEIELLKELTKENLDIYINIPFNIKNTPEILNGTLEILEKMNFSIEYPDKSESNYFEKIGFNLFGDIEDKLEKTDNLKIIEGQNKYLEIKKVFEFIRRYNIKGRELEEMAIVSCHPDYIDIIHKVSQEDNVPINIPQRIQLENLPIINEILNIFNLNFKTDSRNYIINRVKSRYFPILNENFNEKYEYILKKEKFEDLYGLKALIYENTELNIEEKYLVDLNEIIHSIDIEINRMKKLGTIEYYNNEIVNILREYDLVENILKRYINTRDYDLFQRDMDTVKKLKEVLEKMNYLSIYLDEISLENYYEYLLDYMKEESIIIKHGNTKGIQVFNPVNMRGFQKEEVFMVGLNGNYPIIEEENYYLNEYNYAELNNMGIDIKTYMEKLSNEEIKFASMVSSAKENLHLSYNTEESSNMVSMFLEELLSLIDFQDKSALNINYIDLESFINQKIEEITNKKELMRYLVLNKIDLKDKENILNDKLNFKKKLDIINENIRIETEREEEDFNPYKGFIDDKEIREDLKTKMPKKYSISYLESYGKCPYAFMLNQLFNIEDLNRFLQDRTPMDLGNIYHEVLREFYEKYRQSIKEYLIEEKSLDINYRKTLEELIIKNSKKMNWDLSTGENIILLESAIENLTFFIKEDLKRMKKHKIEPYKFEVEFGNEIPVNIYHGEEILPILGRIDRIDKIIDKDKYIVMDYKSSSYGTKDIDHMIQGLSFQLPIYIMSQEEKDVISGMYGILRDGKFLVRIGVLGENSMISKRLKGGLEREEWDNLLDTVKENMINTINNIKKADFSINPLECSTYCIYKDICRYTQVLEVENGD